MHIQKLGSIAEKALISLWRFYSPPSAQYINNMVRY